MLSQNGSMQMNTCSFWDKTKTFFPLFVRQLESYNNDDLAVCIVGASDGKFVLPLAEKGYHVKAIELDETALKGGSINLPSGEVGEMLGLRRRLDKEGLTDKVEIFASDFLNEAFVIPSTDAVFTSCSWHYSCNHVKPLENFIHKMQTGVNSDGIFCAEYMMPVEEKHYHSEHYVQEGKLHSMFNNGWLIIEEFYTEPFVEKAHVGNLTDHWHRMGFFMATKL
jgi:hypothetical protein